MDFKETKLRVIFVVSGHKQCDHGLKSVRTFINDIDCGDIILIEYPLIIESRVSGGPKPFHIKVTNLETMETLKMKITQLYDRVIRFIKEAKELM